MSIINVGEAFGLTDAGTLLGGGPASHRNPSPQRAKAIVEAAEMWGRAWDGSARAALAVAEAMSTSDLFRSVTGDVLDRELLARYEDIPVQWTGYARRVTVRDFKPKNLVDILGGRTPLDQVAELAPYPEAVHDTKEYKIQVGKFGRRFGHSWEASINDDLDELRQIPDQFAQAARLTEDKTARALIANADGTPNAGFFNSGNGNDIATPTLTHTSLSTAITTVSTKKDAQGNVLVPGDLVLVVGPALAMDARRLLNATEIRTGTGSKTVVESNWLKGAITLVVDAGLPGTSWFVLPAPSAPRPAVAVAFLRGHETPDLRVADVSGSRPGGGSVSPEEGSFNEDGVFYRVRHVVGGATVIPTHTYASNGTVAPS